MIEASTETVIGTLVLIFWVPCLIFAAWIFCTETLPKAYWRRFGRRMKDLTDWQWRYGRPPVM